MSAQNIYHSKQNKSFPTRCHLSKWRSFLFLLFFSFIFNRKKKKFIGIVLCFQMKGTSMNVILFFILLLLINKSMRPKLFPDICRADSDSIQITFQVDSQYGIKSHIIRSSCTFFLFLNSKVNHISCFQNDQICISTDENEQKKGETSSRRTKIDTLPTLE